MKSSKRNKILVVDDDPGILRMLIEMLVQDETLEVLSTINGKKACAIACLERPDLIIMDWEMPIMNGIDAVKELKKNPLTKDIPVIISTGIMIDDHDLNNAFVSGAVDYIRKPFNEIELNARVANMIRISELSKTIKHQNIELQNQLTSEMLKIQQLDELKKTTLKHLVLLKEMGKSIDDQGLKDTIVQAERLLNSKVFHLSWVDFESHFAAINPGFFERVGERCGFFTNNELRLCALLKLNMSNKEIAQMLYTSAETVNTARKRLKKKLGLLPKDSLLQFIRDL